MELDEAIFASFKLDHNISDKSISCYILRIYTFEFIFNFIQISSQLVS